jgi:hypothetical protein
MSETRHREQFAGALQQRENERLEKGHRSIYHAKNFTLKLYAPAMGLQS